MCRKPGARTVRARPIIPHAPEFVNRQNAQKVREISLPHLRGHDSTTLYFVPSSVNKNSRSALLTFRSVAPYVVSVSVSRVMIVCFVGLAFLSLGANLYAVGWRPTPRAFLLAFSCSSVSGNGLPPLSIMASWVIMSLASASVQSSFRMRSAIRSFMRALLSGVGWGFLPTLGRFTRSPCGRTPCAYPPRAPPAYPAPSAGRERTASDCSCPCRQGTP